MHISYPTPFIGLHRQRQTMLTVNNKFLRPYAGNAFVSRAQDSAYNKTSVYPPYDQQRLLVYHLTSTLTFPMLRPILTTFVLGAGWLAQAQAPTSFKGEDVYNTHFDRPFHVYVDSSYPSFNSRNIQLRRTKDPTIDLVVVDRSSKVAWMIVKNQTLYDYGTYRQTDYFTKEKIEGQTLYAFKFRRHTVAMNGTGYGDKPHTGFHLANIAPGQYRLETEPKNRTREYEWDGKYYFDQWTTHLENGGG